MKSADLLTGAKLRARRKALKMSHAGVGPAHQLLTRHNTLLGEEGQTFVPGVPYSWSNARARGWGLTLLKAERERLEQKAKVELAREGAREGQGRGAPPAEPRPARPALP